MIPSNLLDTLVDVAASSAVAASPVSRRAAAVERSRNVTTDSGRRADVIEAALVNILGEILPQLTLSYIQ